MYQSILLKLIQELETDIWNQLTWSLSTYYHHTYANMPEYFVDSPYFLR